ncbi:MAG: T9SS type A sorting domain-containing protein [Bacteroidia bacterium]
MKKELLPILFVFLLIINAKAQINTYPASVPKAQQTETVTFTENKGQISDQNYNPRPDVLFGGSVNGMAYHLRNNGISYQLSRVESWKKEEQPGAVPVMGASPRMVPDQTTIYRLDINWLGINKNVMIQTDNMLEGSSNYYLDVCPDGITGVKAYDGVVYHNIYNKINLHYYEKDDNLKYDYIVAPGGNYSEIQLQVEGAENISVQKDGSLLFTTPLGIIQEGAPVVYQNGIQLAAKWMIIGNVLSFDIENYNPELLLTIDPLVRTWGTYYGGTGTDAARTCFTDVSGNVFLLGTTASAAGTVIATTGSHQSTSGGNDDAYLVKFNSAGVRQWGTYFGGTGNDVGVSGAIDGLGNVYVAGYTATSTTGISTVGCHQAASGGTTDGFLVQFNSTSGARQWGTYYGGALSDFAYGCTCDPSGNVFICGQTGSNTAIATGGTQQPAYNSGGGDAFIAKFNSSGVRQFGTYCGGLASDVGYSCVADPNGDVYLAGYSNSTSFIASGQGFQTNNANLNDAFLVKYTTNGLRIWGTWYGGGNDDYGLGCAVDGAGNVYLAGYTGSSSTLNIYSPGCHQTVNNGSNDAFLVKFDGATSARFWGTYYGGTGTEYAYACKVDASGNVYLSGQSSTTAGTTVATAGSYQPTIGGATDAFVAQFNSLGVRQWGTYYGGAGNDYSYGSHITPSGDFYLVGSSDSNVGTIIASAGSHQAANGGVADAYLAKFFICNPPSAPTNTTAIANQSVCYNSSTTLAASGTNTLGWYSASVGGIYLGGGTSYATGNLIATTSFYVQDSSSCGGGTRTQITVTVDPQITSSVTSQINVSCNGGNNGAATLTVGGGTGPYTYAWAPSGGTAISISGRTFGTYTCTITDATGCARTQTVSLTQPTAIASSVSSQTNVSCNGGNNGAATLSVGGGSPTYTYVWAPSGGTGISISGRTSGTYTCTITDANGCTRTQTVSLTQPTAIASSVSSQVNVSCNGGNNGAATIAVSGGTPAYTYAWAPSGGTGISISGRTSGTYTCTITDANACTQTQTVSLTQPTAIASSVSSQTNVSCNGGSNGAATLTVSGGTPTYTYLWAPSGGTGISISGRTSGIYTCTITDANACTQTQTVSLTQPTAIASSVSSQTNVSCNGGNNGAATIAVSGGTPAYTYAWAPSGGNAISISGRTSGTYTCTVTDANGCTRTQTVSLTQPSAISPSVAAQTNVSCNGGNNGAATLSVSGGTPAYTYAWAPSGGNAISISGRTSGAYTCTITDANGCTTTQTVSLTQPSAITSSVTTQTNISCNGGNNGAAGITVTGGAGAYTYSWAPTGGTAAIASGLGAGTYTCAITDANGCNSTQNCTITEPTALNTTSSSSIIACNGGTTNASVTASGGTPGYAYAWLPSGGTSATSSAIGVGSYTCTVSDANGCTSSPTISITEPTVLAVSGVATNPVGCTTNDGSIDITPAGGTPGYSFLWSNSVVTEDNNTLDGGSYSVTITDANGCIVSASFTLTEPGAPVVTYAEVMDTVCQAMTGSFALSGEFPTGGMWVGPGVSGNNFDPMNASIGFNNITYTYIDGGGCSGTAMDSIYVDLCLSINAYENLGWKIYPNPTSGSITIETDMVIESVSIYNVLGDLIQTETEKTFSVEHLSAGVYVLQIKTATGNKTTRIVKD